MSKRPSFFPTRRGTRQLGERPSGSRRARRAAQEAAAAEQSTRLVVVLPIARALGVDYGSKRIGLAVSEGNLALPFEVRSVRTDTEAVVLVVAMAKERGVQAVVVGLPLGLNGQDTNQTVAVREFAKLLAQALRIPVHLQDERLTSAEAHRVRLPLHRHQRGEPVDAQASALLLQAWLDREARTRA